jgi:tRNA U34 5-carboxymethylaminomethyl modifying enzyme MnmG/GidA
VITTRTFLGGLIHIGDVRYPAGRAGEIASLALSSSLKELGFEMGRMKPGAPPRLRASSIDFSRLVRQDSDPDPEPFSFTTERLLSFFSATTDETHRIIRENTNSSEDKRYRDLMNVIGEDPLPYGIKANLQSIETLIDYALQQRLISQRLSVEELFVNPET